MLATSQKFEILSCYDYTDIQREVLFEFHLTLQKYKNELFQFQCLKIECFKCPVYERTLN